MRRHAKAQAPVIVVTADSGATLEADCEAAGADDVIRKPVDLSTLFTTIGDLIARRGQEGLVLSWKAEASAGTEPAWPGSPGSGG